MNWIKFTACVKPVMDVAIKFFFFFFFFFRQRSSLENAHNVGKNWGQSLYIAQQLQKGSSNLPPPQIHWCSSGGFSRSSKWVSGIFNRLKTVVRDEHSYPKILRNIDMTGSGKETVLLKDVRSHNAKSKFATYQAQKSLKSQNFLSIIHILF